jgi:hypothetical protein
VTTKKLAVEFFKQNMYTTRKLNSHSLSFVLKLEERKLFISWRADMRGGDAIRLNTEEEVWFKTS